MKEVLMDRQEFMTSALYMNGFEQGYRQGKDHGWAAGYNQGLTHGRSNPVTDIDYEKLAKKEMSDD